MRATISRTTERTDTFSTSTPASEFEHCENCGCDRRPKLEPDICYVEASSFDHSLNETLGARDVSGVIYNMSAPPKHLGVTENAPLVSARHVDIMRAKLSSRYRKTQHLP